MIHILILNGPNLDLLGFREPSIYGNKTYQDICQDIINYAEKAKVNIKFYQTNHEGVIIDQLHLAYTNKFDGIIINPAAYAHYSYAIYDALKCIKNIVKVEVHLTDITKREEFRRTSVTAEACDKLIYGHGVNGYFEAIDFIKENVRR